ncbi:MULTISPECIES: VOC family protein [Microbacteriaceae]|uniref:VOC family protein n=1 Tax=Microbacteriaceae TaxID=85023 RepID=UPI00037DC624|nr:MULTISPECIES: VOC family protein [Microbacteriaceae]TDP98850.1 putative glyoxalase superfamily protein PhnB [Leifsonia sp. 115AMFTsu3.1]
MISSAVTLSYRDAPAAIAWLEALGFDVLQLQSGQDGSVLHSELRWADTVVMLASNDAAYDVPPLVGASTGVGLYLVTQDVDGMFARAVDAGATVVFPPEETEWGSRRARVLDPGGREWSFGSYRPGEQWSASA